jgi:pyrimidine-nucleoside phosphorylase
MRVQDLIKLKRDGKALDPAAITELIAEITANRVPDYQVAAMLMAIFWRGMDETELTAWTEAMTHSGKVVDLSSIPQRKVDKHSTGGVGDKVSICLAPLVAACGLSVPMISGRGLGHTGGTLDKLEAIPGFETQQEIPKFAQIVQQCGLSLIGQTDDLAPADRRLYALRDVTATVESVPLISSSIMSKKLAEGIDGLVLDVKIGSGAFMKSDEQGRELARTIIAIGNGAGKTGERAANRYEPTAWQGNRKRERNARSDRDSKGWWPRRPLAADPALGRRNAALGRRHPPTSNKQRAWSTKPARAVKRSSDSSAASSCKAATRASSTSPASSPRLPTRA